MAAAETLTKLFSAALAAHQSGQLAEAAVLYDAILMRQPEHADALHLRGVVDFQSGDKQAALARIEAAIRLSRADPRYFYNLGTVLMALALPHEAAEQFRITTAMDPQHAAAHGNLGAALCEMGARAEAVGSFRAALAITPDDANTWSNLSSTLTELGQAEDAAVCLRRALALAPENSDALTNLGFALQKAGDVGQASACFARAIETNPRNAKALFNLATLLLNNPLADEPELALTCFRQALAINPDHHHAHSNLLMALQYSASTTPGELFEQHRVFGRHFEASLQDSRTAHANTRQPQRRLRVGYVSADFHNHAVASFIAPILAAHDTAGFEVFCYYNNVIDDVVTAQLRSHVPHWNACLALSDAALADKIRADGIDVLVDLSGHTGGNRLLTFARKPAPVQLTWVGYPGTTGLDSMDYFIADRFYLPPGALDSQFSEHIVRLPIAGTFQPFEGAPAVAPLPALTSTAFTFGSFNQVHKFSDGVVALWSQLLHAVPEAHLLLAGMPPAPTIAPGVADTSDASMNQAPPALVPAATGTGTSPQAAALLARFVAHGIEAGRIILLPRCTLDEYMALHHHIDMCLDTFPYTGGTTTLHAAWMGVPTLTLAGHTAAGRQGCIAPGHLGLPGCVAENPADFVAKGVAWASDRPALAAVRASMRARFAASLIIQPQRVTRDFERALRIMWQRYCDGLAPIAFALADAA